MTFDLDALENERTYEPFRFAAGGREFQLPHTDLLTGDQAELMGVSPRSVLEQVADKATADAALSQPAWKVQKLMQAWLSHAGLGSGEDSASSDS